ncbi:MAG: 1-(5-phosphoribosyl)-5-[(5-phosphoribosylamino)methylideneamino]imidazole-4-carboxamide isomerase [Methanoregulaceae archaeon]|jgi:phosphoribosylformimino-5-aminoimidazole carboxamide ribotide isomerase|nr:1-(5-phosphoribosyl)-5-[(5-phosphoribosylamino)methylideneamino]imidazole-4-carboxamide isomerase [Methanoregulaceae archaeon]MCU0628039.1 1-(5-phosphoribosyl)-5-[(5-phosphoribosylamino)methylideneamino]imidazole-4-carboxamide isomerase [Methanoregulaceae archaeon]
MKVFPAVDILSGRCVQLVQGKRDSAISFGRPIDCAMRWINAGAHDLHVVNLDGAFGNSSENLALIREIIRETGVTIQLGGGIRSFVDAAGWLDSGVGRVIIGTLAVKDPAVLTKLSDAFGRDRIMAGVDARNGSIAVEGWERTGGDYVEWARTFEEMGAGSLLFTNVDVEGLQQGICIQPVSRLIDSVTIPVVVAGGVSSGPDVRALKEIGAYGVVLGSALYSGKLTLREALEAADEKG